MSASLDQRSKGQPNQVVNGPGGKPVKEEEFEAYLQPQPHQGAYGAGPMSSPGDPYMSSYYNPSVTFPYLGQNTIGDGGAWSSGGDAMFSVGSYDYSGMFNFGYPQFGWDFPGSEYWTTPAQQQQPQQQQQQQPGGRKDNRMDYADYYRTDALPPMDGYGAAMNGELEREMPVGMNKIEQGLKGMSIMDKKQQMDAGVIPLDHQDHNIHGHGHPHAHLGNGDVGHLGQLSNNPVVSQAPKKTSWAAIASQPARAQPQMKSRTIPRAPVNPSKHGMDIGTWDNKNNMGGKPGGGPVPLTGGGRQAPWGAPRGRTVTAGPYSTSGQHNMGGPGGQPPLNSMNGPPVSNVYMNRGGGGGAPVIDSEEDIMAPPDPVAEKFSVSVNPKDFNLNPRGARFFIIKSYSEDDIHRSIKYSIWCSTEHGNKRLDGAYKEREGKGPVFLFFSVNGSGHFCGMAQMMSNVDYGSSSAHWAQDKWKGQFHVKWVYVKDVPNSQLRHIRLENNENKPVTNSRDTQEVPPEKGKQVLKIMHSYRNATSIFDDFNHYEIRQLEDQTEPPPPPSRGGRGDGRDNSQDGHDGGGRDNRDNGRDRDGSGRDNRDNGRDNRVDGRGDGGRGDGGRGDGGRGDGGRGDGRDGRSSGGRQN